MKQIFSFDGKDLTKYLIITNDFYNLVGYCFDTQIYDYETLDGSFFVTNKNKSKTITVPFITKNNPTQDFDDIQKILNVEEPKKLILGDNNRFFYAVPTGNFGLKRKNHKGIGEITFLIPDSYAYSNYTNEFDFVKNPDGTWETTVYNNSSEAVPIDYRIKLKKESGYIGLVSEHGVMQFGKVDESDNVEEEKAVTLTENKNGNFANWTNASVFYENQSKKIVTTMTSDTSYGGRLGLLPKNFSNTLNGSYFGACKEFVIPDGKEPTDWYLWAKAWFETGLFGQTCEWCISIVDENNHLIAAMAIEKYDRVGNTASVNFLMGDGNGGSSIKQTQTFYPTVWVKQNPYGSEGREQNRNMFDIKKTGNTVEFYYYGSYFSFTDNRLTNLKAKRVQFYVGQMSGQDTSNQIVTHHYINDLSFIDLKAKTWRDVANRYPNNADIYISGSEGRIYVNNLVASKDEQLGTEYFYAPPGSTKIRLGLSSFSELDKAKAIIRGAWL